MVSLATTTAPGSVSLGASSSCSRTGFGCSHGTSAKEGSDGTRRLRLRSASRHALVAILYSQARNPGPPWKLPRRRQARRKVSCARSSASSNEPSIR